MAKATGHIEIEVADEVLMELVRNIPMGDSGTSAKGGKPPKSIEAVLEFTDFGGQVRFATEGE